MDWAPHVTVASIIERDGQFLFVQERIAGQLVINQPAGHLEDKESLLHAAHRETLEETAWHVKLTTLVGIYQWRHPQKHNTYLRFCFSGEGIEHEQDRPLDSDIEQTIWLTREQLVNSNYILRTPMVLKCLDDYLAGQRLDLSVLNMFDYHD